MVKKHLAPSPTAATEEPRYRSGAVARMVRMPVATLRIWQRRYRVAEPVLTASGQRLYSAADVRRLALIKQLTDLGHAIGNLAPLDWAQLQAVTGTHASTVAGQSASTRDGAATSPWRVAVVGDALAQRLRRPALRRALGRAMHVNIVVPQRRDLLATLKVTAADIVIVDESSPDASAWRAWLTRLRKVHTGQVALLYRFAPDAVGATLAAAGVTLLRDPQTEVTLGQWLGGLAGSASRAAPTAAPAQAERRRRWDDAQLSDFAALSSTIACECPRHVAELVMQLSHFETYSADCAHRDPADAALHDYLRGVASASRAMFEDALERVAVHEGLLLPA